MDPLSVTASVLAVAAAAQKTCSALNDLHSTFKMLPGRLHALNNEVADLEIVLHQLATSLKERESALNLEADSPHERIASILTRIQSLLAELCGFIERIETAGGSSMIAPAQRVRAWRRHLPRLNDIQDEIREAKSSLNIIIGTSNLHDMLRVRLDLVALTTMASGSSSGQHDNNNEPSGVVSTQQEQLLEQMFAHVNKHIGDVKALIQDQATRYEEDKLALLRRAKSDAGRTSSPPPAYSRLRQESVGIRVASSACRRGCPCGCHKSQKTGSPSLLNRVLGQIFIEYTAIPAIKVKCDAPACTRTQRPQVQAEYWFPIGVFWSQIIRFQATYHATMGPSFQLKTLRRVPDSAQAVNFAISGNIKGLQQLFDQGAASPQDVSDTRGYSLLRWALYAQQYETCRFLYYAGADPDYRPKAISDNSPRNKASDIILQGGLSSQVVDTLSCLKNDDWVDEQNFPLLHRIVTGFCGRDLEEELMYHPETVNGVDAMGRTALLWAAARGDERSTVTLLSYGADANIMDIQHAGPLSYAADRNHAVCTRILLEAGAEPDPVIPGGYKIGSPLNCASRNANDPLIIKALLDFNADVDACGVDGRTPLLHAARTDNAAFALLFLEHNANINAVSSAGQTPLTTAITNNSHRVLSLLLDRWSDYSTCPRLSGPHLIRTVAEYADSETLAIVSMTDHFRLKYDKSYSSGDFDIILRQRHNSSEKLEQDFHRFLSIVNQEYSPEEMMESGIAWSSKEASLLGSDGEDSDEFHDAIDHFEDPAQLVILS